MPSLNQLWAESKDKGLHIIHIESQGHSQAEVQEFCQKNGMAFPNTTDSSGFSSYKGDNGLPYAFVIGVEGKVVFEGRGNYKAAIHEELAKVRYPGLGKHSVAEPVHKSALLFGQRQYAKAISEAEKAKEKLADDADAAAVADAEYVIARALAVAERQRARIEQAKSSRDYDIALEQLDALSKSFKGHEVGDKAKDELKDLKKDDAVEDELDALALLHRLEAMLDKERDPEKRKAALEAFAKKHEGTRAAERALAKTK